MNEKVEKFTDKDIRVFKGVDGLFSAMLKRIPEECEPKSYRTYICRYIDAKTEKEAIMGIKSIYPELFHDNE